MEFTELCVQQPKRISDGQAKSLLASQEYLDLLSFDISDIGASQGGRGPAYTQSLGSRPVIADAAQDEHDTASKELTLSRDSAPSQGTADANLVVAQSSLKQTLGASESIILSSRLLSADAHDGTILSDSLLRDEAARNSVLVYSAKSKERPEPESLADKAISAFSLLISSGNEATSGSGPSELQNTASEKHSISTENRSSATVIKALPDSSSSTSTKGLTAPALPSKATRSELPICGEPALTALGSSWHFREEESAAKLIPTSNAFPTLDVDPSTFQLDQFVLQDTDYGLVDTSSYNDLLRLTLSIHKVAKDLYRNRQTLLDRISDLSQQNILLQEEALLATSHSSALLANEVPASKQAYTDLLARHAELTKAYVALQTLASSSHSSKQRGNKPALEFYKFSRIQDNPFKVDRTSLGENSVNADEHQQVTATAGHVYSGSRIPSGTQHTDAFSDKASSFVGGHKPLHLDDTFDTRLDVSGLAATGLVIPENTPHAEMLSKANIRVAQLEADVARLSSESEHLQLELRLKASSYSETTNGLLSRLESAEKRSTSLSNENTDLQVKLSMMNQISADYKELKQQSATLTTELCSTKQLADTQRKEVSELKREVDRATLCISQTTKKNATLLEQNAKLMDEVASLEARVSTIADDLSTAREQALVKCAEADELSRRFNEATRRYGLLQKASAEASHRHEFEIRNMISTIEGAEELQKENAAYFESLFLMLKKSILNSDIAVAKSTLRLIVGPASDDSTTGSSNTMQNIASGCSGSSIHEIPTDGEELDMRQKTVLVLSEVLSGIGSLTDVCKNTKSLIADETKKIQHKYENDFKRLLKDLMECRRKEAEACGREAGLSIAVDELRNQVVAMKRRTTTLENDLEAAKYRIEEMDRTRQLEHEDHNAKITSLMMECEMQLKLFRDGSATARNHAVSSSHRSIRVSRK